jgi:glycosyltransferase involved in cell wall biosynthesis
VFGECAAARLVEHIGNGWVCGDRTVESLLKVLSEFSSDTKRAKRMGELGYEYAKSNFSISESCKHWESLLMNLH